MNLIFLLFIISTPFHVILLLAAAINLFIKRSEESSKTPGISVIVAARNEEHNLPRLLKSLDKLNYPKDLYEVIIINDHSTDGTLEILANHKPDYNFRYIDWQGEQEGVMGKKAAVLQGINAAKHDILAFTDADCVVPPNWLRGWAKAYADDVDYVLSHALILRDERDSYFRMKCFEDGVYYSLAALGMSIRRPFTSVACNMSYRKSTFFKAGGYDGIGHLASGDDDLLLMKMMPHIRKAIYYPSPEMRVRSYEGRDIVKRHHTNIRRASKLQYFPRWLQAVGVATFLHFIFFYLSLILLLVYPGNTLLYIALATKMGAELGLCVSHSVAIKLPWLGALYPVAIVAFPAQFIFYSIWGSIGKYNWK